MKIENKMRSFVFFVLITNILLCGFSFASERVAYFVIPGDPKLSNMAQDVEYFLKKYIEKRVMIPAEITNREIAVFEDEINRQNQEAEKLIIEGKKLYEEFNLDQCFFIFQRIINNYEKGLAAFSKSKDYQLALMYLGNIYQLKGDTGLARDTFIKLLTYNNKYVPDTTYFPPDIIDTFEKARNEFKTLRKGVLQVIPKPEDAQIYVDGVFIGSGIFKVGDLPVGEHIVGIRKRGYLPYTRKVTIQPELMEIITAELVNFSEISERYKEVSKIKEEDISITLLPVLKKYEKDAGASSTVIIFLSGGIDKVNLSGYTFFNGRLIAYQDKSISFLKDDSRKKVLKTEIDNLLQAILPEDIKNATPVNKINRKKFYNTWWFYGIIGAVLIGAGALGYVIVGDEEKDSNHGTLIISF